jgi:hypothetical protein
VRRLLGAQRPGGSLTITLVRPDLRDTRLHLSAVVTTLQVLGQTVLGFKVSIAQILVTVAVAGVLDGLIVLWRERVIAWPASGLLTGNSVAFILRASGTQHGDWWSLHGIHLFVAAAVASVLSKYVVRVGGRHVFNPSNVGLVGCFLLAGLTRTFPQYLWWGPLDVPVIAALAVIAFGAVWIVRPLGMLPMVGAYLATFAAVVTALAASGRSFYAIWHLNAIRGVAYVVHIVASPELLIFVLFMMTDPRTAPRRPGHRLLFAVATAGVSGLLIAPQRSEFGVKVAILAGLTVTTALVPALERRARFGAGTLCSALVVLIVVAVTCALGADDELVRIERGLSGSIQ